VSRTVDESPAAVARAEPQPPSRAELERHPAQVLKDDGPGAPRVVRYALPDAPVVLKEWIPTRSRLVNWWGRNLLRREIRNYRLLEGVAGIPRFLGAYGDQAFLMAWVDGEPLRRRLPRALKDSALLGLERTMAGLHARRFVHLDLHQKLNALVAPDGEVWLVDLGQGLDCRRGLLRRLLFPLLARIDRRALVKFRARYAPHMLPEDEREALVEQHRESRGKAWKHLHRRLRRHLLRERD